VSECFGKYFILNGKLLPAEMFHNSMVYEGESFYEVIRVMKGVPVFFNDHIARLESGVSIQGRQMLADINTIKSKIIGLSESEKIMDINLKVVFNFNGPESNCLIYYIPSFYPADEQYRNGVKGVLFNAERRDPGVKLINSLLRSEINHKLSVEKGYEALLVNRNGFITEGSRSNIFFISGNRLVTAPDDSVLGGITRKYLIEICCETGIPLEYRCINVSEISDFESVVMTGTSPVVLPLRSVDDILFNVSHPLIAHLRNLYLKKAEESMTRF
jgi:branched-chain amino acid aminotransferase